MKKYTLPSILDQVSGKKGRSSNTIYQSVYTGKASLFLSNLQCTIDSPFRRCLGKLCMLLTSQFLSLTTNLILLSLHSQNKSEGSFTLDGLLFWRLMQKGLAFWFSKSNTQLTVKSEGTCFKVLKYL